MADKFVRGGGKGAGEGIFADQVLEALKFLFGDQETMEVTGPDGVKREVTLNEAASIGSIVGAAGRKLATDAAQGIAKKEAKNTASLTRPRKSKGAGSPASSTKSSGSPVPKKSPDAPKRPGSIGDGRPQPSAKASADQTRKNFIKAGYSKQVADEAAEMNAAQWTAGMVRMSVEPIDDAVKVVAKTRPPAGVSSVTGGPTLAKGKPFGPTRTAAQKRAAAKKKAAAEEANKAGSEGPKKITPRNKKTSSEKETVNKGTQKSRQATDEGDELRAMLDAEEASRASVTPLREKGTPLSSVRLTPGLKPTDPSKYGKGGRTRAQQKADVEDFMAAQLRQRDASPGGRSDLPPSMVDPLTKSQKKIGDLEAKDGVLGARPQGVTPSVNLTPGRTLPPKDPGRNAPPARRQRYREARKAWEKKEQARLVASSKSIERLRAEEFARRAKDQAKTSKPTPATPKATPKAPTPAAAREAGTEGPKTYKQFKADGDKRTFKKNLPKPAPKDPAKKAAAQKKQPVKKQTAAQKKVAAAANKAGTEGKSGGLVRQRAGTLANQRPNTTPIKPNANVDTRDFTYSWGTPRASGPFPMPPAAGGAKPVPTPKQAPGLKKKVLRGAAATGVGGAAIYGATKAYNATDNRPSDTSDANPSSDTDAEKKTTPSSDKYGRKISKKEFEKREAFRKSRKAGADGKSRRVTADRAVEARKTELKRRKKFRKGEGKEEFGKAATRVTKDKSKLAAKGVRQSQQRREAALRKRNRDFPSR